MGTELQLGLLEPVEAGTQLHHTSLKSQNRKQAEIFDKTKLLYIKLLKIKYNSIWLGKENIATTKMMQVWWHKFWLTKRDIVLNPFIVSPQASIRKKSKTRLIVEVNVLEEGRNVVSQWIRSGGFINHYINSLHKEIRIWVSMVGIHRAHSAEFRFCMEQSKWEFGKLCEWTYA